MWDMQLSRRHFLSCSMALAVGCAAPNANRKGASKEEGNLLRSAEIYWQSVRWADAERASAFIEDPSQRLLYKEWLEKQSDERRYEEATVIQAVIGDEQDKPVDGRTREAVVFVRARGYELPAQILETWKVRQTWYRTPTGWFVEWEDPEGGLEGFMPETGGPADPEPSDDDATPADP